MSSPDTPAETSGGDPPGRGLFGPTVDRLDRSADALLECVRGEPTFDRLMTFATHAGEFSLIWHASSALRGVARGRSRQTVALAIGIGLESLIVNQGLKRLFGRQRPTEEGDDRFEIRKPLTSSFPSGHASAAAFAATVLISWDGKRWAPLWGGLAGIVALSRPYVRIHHASDVVGGLIAGSIMGWGAIKIFARRGLD